MKLKKSGAQRKKLPKKNSLILKLFLNDNMDISSQIAITIVSIKDFFTKFI